MTDVYRTPDEWCAIKSVQVMDPDGWRGDMIGRSWEDPINEYEFNWRFNMSTVRIG